MIKFLPFILIPVLVVSALGYWRYSVSKVGITTPLTQQQDQAPIEVPKTVPASSLDDRVKSLEDIISKLVTQVNDLKSSSKTVSQSSFDSRLTIVESAITDLKARVSSLEKVTPAPASSAKSTVFIPLGSGGSWGDQSWYSLNEYQVSLDPADYSGYTSMRLEIIFRIVNGSTGSVRLYNSTDNNAISSEVSTTSSNFGLSSSSSFTLPAGSKTYNLQVKTSGGSVFIELARIRVNF